MAPAATPGDFNASMASTASPSDMFGGLDQRESQDWVWRDQTSLAHGFGNWGLPAGSSEDGSPAMGNTFPENGYMQLGGFGGGAGPPGPFGAMATGTHGMDVAPNNTFGAEPTTTAMAGSFDGRNVFNGIAIGTGVVEEGGGGAFDPNKGSGSASGSGSGSFGDLSGYDQRGWYC